MTSDSANIAVVGPGLVGSQHIARIEANPNSRLAAVVSPNGFLSDAAPVFSSVCNLIDSDLILDGVMICSPTSLHLEHLLLLLQRSKFCFIEKPVFPSGEDCFSALKQIGEEDRRRCLVGHHRRYSPKFKTLEDALLAGSLGKIACYSGHICFYKPDKYFEEAQWRMMQRGGGPIFINLIHEVDMLRELFGPVKRVSGFSTGGEPGESEVENTVVVNIEHHSGVLGSFTVSDRVHSTMSWERTVGENPAFPNDGSDYLYLFGSKGSLAFPSFSVEKGNHLGWTGEVVRSSIADIDPDTTADPIFNQLDHFVSLCLGRESSALVTLEDAIDNTLICEAIVKSLGSMRAEVVGTVR